MKTLDLGNGLKLTQSKDMGIFLHFRTKDEKSDGGVSMEFERGRAGFEWAVEMLESVPEIEEEGSHE